MNTKNLAYGTDSAQKESDIRMFSNDCLGHFGIDSVFVFCERKKGHKGKCSFKTDNLEMKWTYNES